MSHGGRQDVLRIGGYLCMERLEARRLLSGAWHHDADHADDLALDHPPELNLEGGGEADAPGPQTSSSAPAAGPNIQITDALLVDGRNRPITAPAVGQMVYIRAHWTTTDLTSADQYVVRYWVDGVPADSATQTGQTGTQNRTWYRGGWYASPGTRTVQVTVDGAGAVAETDESDNSITFTFTPVAPTTLPERFVNPIRGTQGIEWTIVNYADLDPRSGIRRDYRGGPFQYDGHGGIDFTLANFTKMDASVAVVAAAGGTVTAAEDGYFDRETTWTGTPYNFVEITHGNGWRTRYLHLATNTLTVRYGETVARGQLLALVGSSGSSTDAHLHFHVYHDDAGVETYFDPAAYWLAPLPYQGDADAQVMDSGISNYTVWPDFKERPSGNDVFPISQTWDVWLWARMSHLRAGDKVDVYWYRPSGALHTMTPNTASTIIRYGAHGWTLPRSAWSAYPGEWEVSLHVNGAERRRHGFRVTTGAGTPQLKLLQSDTRIINGHTTPVDFGYGNVGNDPALLTFTAHNHGGAPLSLMHISFPPGFSLASPLPTEIPPGGSGGFTLRLDTVRPGIKFGEVALTSNDADEPLWRFNVSGHVTGPMTAGTPYVALPGRAVPFAPGSPPRVIDPAAEVVDNDSPHLENGSLVVEMAGFSSASDRLAIRHQGSAAGQIGVSGSKVLYGGTAIGTLAGGAGAVPLAITFNASANVAAVQALLRSVTYGSEVAFPVAVRRYLRVTVTDELGKVSVQPVKTIAFDTIAPSDLPFAWMNGSRLNVRFDEASPEPITIGSSGAQDYAARDGGESLAFSSVSEIVVFGTSGSDLLRLDSLLRPIAFHSGDGDDTVKVTTGTYTFGPDLAPTASNIAVSAAAGAHVVFDSTQHLRALDVAGSAALSPGGGQTLVVTGLTMSTSGKLDLADNALIVDYTGPGSPLGSFNGSSYTGIAGMIQSGRTVNATWDGAGIVTSMPDAAAGLSGLGVGEAAYLLGLRSGETALWEGHIIDATTVIVKYTYAGDANLDGRIDAGDYGIIDNFVQVGGASGYGNGDFNYDGFIDAGDYGIIDNNIQAQTAPTLLASPATAPDHAPLRQSYPYAHEFKSVDEEASAPARRLRSAPQVSRAIKNPSKSWGFEWSDGESNPDLLNAIQPSSR